MRPRTTATAAPRQAVHGPVPRAVPRGRFERRRRVVRRRLAALVVVGVSTALGVGVVWPALQTAVRDLTLPLHHADIIRQQAREKRLDPALIAAVIYAESRFVDRTSSTGALGLMQLEPATADFIARKSGATRFSLSDLATPQVNIAYGSWYLRYLLERYRGSPGLAIAAYNAGEANVDRWVASARERGIDLSTEAIPFPETRTYVQRVLQAQSSYRAQYGAQLGPAP
jgi:soluble lytic murein transglycosylase